MPNRQDEVIASIPSYLRQFVVHQHYNEYTPQDHAVWRYVMRRNLDFLKDHAHPAYVEGLQKTGINVEYIPHIDEMNDRLSKIGWKAVVVDGFVPPAAFMEFQAHKILVISAEIRNFKNILYTPAPDIIHEAAGHAPIIADSKYAEFLQKTGEYGSKAVFSKLDYDIYEGIRQLSIIKEYPDATPEEVSEAEKHLESLIASNTKPSESAYLARLHWWTVEYGLIGKPEDFKIFGAGILSSVGESKACLEDSVKKIALSVDCSKVDYDITNMQPQLFVARDFDHLHDVLEEFADSMCFRKGGHDSAMRVVASENVGTLVLNSGLQISGTFTEVIPDSNGHAWFIRTNGPTSLAFSDNELDGHGIEYHADGFSSPLGRVKGFEAPLESLGEKELTSADIEAGKATSLHFESGYRVSGEVKSILRKNGMLLLISFSNCTVTSPEGDVLFKPEWGTFDMAVGTRIVSVFSGSADKEKFNVYPPKSEKKAIKVIHTDKQKALFKLYTEIEDLRKSGVFNMDRAEDIYRRISEGYESDWLVRLELYELVVTHKPENSLLSDILTDLDRLKRKSAEYEDLITAGLRFVHSEEVHTK